ncbi:MAG TPA: phage terminase large subunit [Gammaproteobacteria bacterium]|nr:phage terminase large subunit [Gammaproteobacteria bacterium]
MRRIPIEYPAKLDPIWEPRRFKIIHGGRGGGKSHTVAQALLAKGVAESIRVLCVREVQKSVEKSSKQVLVDYINKLGLTDCYEVLKTEIRSKANDTAFDFTGLRDQTADSLKSAEGTDICWAEEAHSISTHSWNVLIPTIRKPGSEIWATFNATHEDDYVYDRFVAHTDPDAWVCRINGADNPWFPPELTTESAKLKNLNEGLWRHVYGGECMTQAGVIFQRDWFRFYSLPPSRLNIYIASDYGVTDDGGDHTEHGVWGLSPTGELYALDWWYGQADPAEWIDQWIELIAKHRPLAAFEEKGVILRSLDSSINKRMRETQTFVRRVALPSASSKAERALGFAARASAGTVLLPEGKPWSIRLLNQLCAFTGEDGRADDAVDVCSLIGRGLDQMANAAPAEQRRRRSLINDYSPEFDDYGPSWKTV